MSGDNPPETFIVIPICILGLLVSVLWLYVQLDKLALLRTLEKRGEEAFPELKESIELTDQRRLRMLPNASVVLAWTFPLVFVLAWIYLSWAAQYIL